MYTILAYLAVFRLDELGVHQFKELCSSQEPSKVSTFVAYVFNKVSNLCSRTNSWIDVVDFLLLSGA